MGLTRTDAVGKKRIYEAEFQKRVDANPQWKLQYGNLLRDIGNAYNDILNPGIGRDHYNEIIGRIELFTIAAQLNTLVAAYEKDGETGYKQQFTKVKTTLEGILPEYSPIVDQKLFEVLMEMYATGQDKNYVSPLLLEMWQSAGKSYEKLAASIYTDTRSFNSSTALRLYENPTAEMIQDLKNMQLLRLYNDILKTYQARVQGSLNDAQGKINTLQREYMQAQMEVMKEKKFYPDANSTLRVTYGKVKGYNARDAVKFDYYTYLDGAMEKYKPGDYEFDIPEKLRTLYKNKDYGVYGSGGKMPVCFIATNHTTGGNSGSPALDAYGNLVGLNFDRVWEGTMSDINYDPSICRNIMVDIRYVLFIVDKYAGAGHLVKEMKLVRPKKK